MELQCQGLLTIPEEDDLFSSLLEVAQLGLGAPTVGPAAGRGPPTWARWGEGNGSPSLGLFGDVSP
jgi:hypothetical protein